MVRVLSTAIAPLASAETFSGRVMPQMPGPVDLGRGDDGVGKGDLLAGKAGVLGLSAPDRPLGMAKESAARETQSRDQHEQHRRNATRHDATLRLLP